MRVGVTGATGFIGGAIVPALLHDGHEVVAVDDLSGPIRVEQPSHPPLVADFASEPALRALGDCDAILHLAAVSGVMACANDPVRTFLTNVQGTRRLTDYCREHRIPLAFASSLAVVGTPQELPVTEATPARPTHEYARQKAAAEELVAAPGAQGKFPTAVLRMSNVYGSYVSGGRTIEKGNVLTVFLRQAREGRITVNAPGTQRRDFVHIADVVAHWQAALLWLRRRTETPATATFNVASGESFSVEEVARTVQNLWVSGHPSGTTPRIDTVPNPRGGVELVDPEFEVSRLRTERELGVRCRRTVEDFLRMSSVG